MRKVVFVLLILSVIAVKVTAQPIIAVNHHTVPENPKVGYFILSIDVSNAGSDVKNIELRVYENERNFALISNGKEVSSLYLNLGDLSSGTTSASFKVFAQESGIYQLNVKLKYSYSVNNTSRIGYIDKIIAIIVSERPNFIVDGSLAIKPLESKNLGLKIRNIGGKAKEVNINFETPENVICDANLAFDKWNANEEKDVFFKLIANKNAEVGAHFLILKISYTDEFGNKNTQRIPVTLEIYGEPRLVLSGFSLNPERIYPDSEFVLEALIENIGVDEAKNIKAELEIPETFFGEKERFIGSLKRDSVAKTEFTLNVNNNTESGSYTFTINLEYENAKGSKYSNSYDFQVFVSKLGIISLDIAGVYTSPQTITAGDRFKLSLQIENSGKQNAKALSIKLLLPEGFEGRDSYFIGGLESGDSATATFELKAGSSGKHTIKAIITYVDSKFEKYTVDKEFTLYIFPKSYIGIYAVAAFIIALGVFYYWRVRKK